MNSFSGSDINQHKIYGVMVGEVTNIQDPDKIGRVKVKMHDLYEDLETDWIRVVSLYAGKDRGNFFLPEVGDEVLISFKNGNIDTPFVIGSLWNLTDKPPEENSDGKNNIKMLKTRSGHTVTLDDTEGKENINIKTA
ncbi:MAG: phage baseplate assembly protein V, partial [Acidaminobacteraceae bacterium]